MCTLSLWHWTVTNCVVRKEQKYSFPVLNWLYIGHKAWRRHQTASHRTFSVCMAQKLGCNPLHTERSKYGCCRLQNASSWTFSIKVAQAKIVKHWTLSVSMEQATKCFMLNVLSFHSAGYKILHAERSKFPWCWLQNSHWTSFGSLDGAGDKLFHYTRHVLSMRGRGDTLLYTWHSQGEWWRWRTASHLDFLMWMVEATNCFTLGVLSVNGWGNKLLHTWRSQCEWLRRQTASHLAFSMWMTEATNCFT